MHIRLHHLGSVDSTNERAFAELDAGSAGHGDLYVASEQTAGRGRRGASWVSPRGTGLYASLVVVPPPRAPGTPLKHRAQRTQGAHRLHPGVLTMASGLAVLRATRGLGLAAAELKWPNDVLVRGAKLAGILVETRGSGPGPLPFVVGIGLNVAQRTFPRELTEARAVTSLALEGLDLDANQVLAPLVEELERALALALDEPAATVDAYAEALGLLGQPIRVRMAGEVLEGTLSGLDLERGLSLAGPAPRDLALEHVLSIESLGRERAGP